MMSEWLPLGSITQIVTEYLSPQPPLVLYSNTLLFRVGSSEFAEEGGLVWSQRKFMNPRGFLKLRCFHMASTAVLGLTSYVA